MPLNTFYVVKAKFIAQISTLTAAINAQTQSPPNILQNGYDDDTLHNNNSPNIYLNHSYIWKSVSPKSIIVCGFLLTPLTV